MFLSAGLLMPWSTLLAPPSGWSWVGLSAFLGGCGWLILQSVAAPGRLGHVGDALPNRRREIGGVPMLPPGILGEDRAVRLGSHPASAADGVRVVQVAIDVDECHQSPSRD